MRYTVAAVAAIAVLFAECSEGGGAGPAPEPPPQACLVVADNPHKSSTAERKGQLQIIGKGWFKCSAGPPRDVTVYVQVQQKTGAGWNKIANNSQPFTRVVVGRKSDPVPAVVLGCPSGTFRTAAKITGHDDNGTYLESDWSYSATEVDPCAKK